MNKSRSWLQRDAFVTEGSTHSWICAKPRSSGSYKEVICS
jgi:hypothetical protein